MDENEDEFNFEEIDFTSVALDEVAKLMVPFFKALRARGLSVNEAAAMTAHYWITNANQAAPEEPKSGN